MRYTVPNWAQSHLAQAVGLDPKRVAEKHTEQLTGQLKLPQ